MDDFVFGGGNSPALQANVSFSFIDAGSVFLPA